MPRRKGGHRSGRPSEGLIFSIAGSGSNRNCLWGLVSGSPYSASSILSRLHGATSPSTNARFPRFAQSHDQGRASVPCHRH